MKPSIGERLGPYRLEQLAGRGSMADVYQARHVDTGEQVAVKLMHPHLIQQPSALRRFRREAEVMLKVRHPHIAQVYECVAEAETAYIVMEYLAGGTLEQRLAKVSLQHGSVPLEQVDRWMTIICAAVDYAHRHGLVHRDLKPANIMFRDDDAPVLTDFGLAYWVDQPRLSGTGSLTGTPAYISPEQARGQAGDRRSDVYSLGVILYEMLTGQTPFQGGTLGVVIKHISDLPPAPRIFGRHLHPNVEAVVMRTLAKEPVERYQSAQSLAAALHLAVERSTAAVAPHPAACARPAPSGMSARLSRPILAGAAMADDPPLVIESYLPPVPSPGLRHWAPPALALAGLVALVGVLWWAAAEWLPADAAPPATSPRFAVGSAVRAVGGSQASVSVLRGCPTGFWMGVLGMADDGEAGRVLERQTCDGEWWYRVAFPDAADEQWDGSGWLSGANLEVR